MFGGPGQGGCGEGPQLMFPNALPGSPAHRRLPLPARTGCAGHPSWPLPHSGLVGAWASSPLPAGSVCFPEYLPQGPLSESEVLCEPKRTVLDQGAVCLSPTQGTTGQMASMPPSSRGHPSSVLSPLVSFIPSSLHLPSVCSSVPALPPSGLVLRLFSGCFVPSLRAPSWMTGTSWGQTAWSSQRAPRGREGNDPSQCSENCRGAAPPEPLFARMQTSRGFRPRDH